MTAREPEPRPERPPDPTRVTDQPALRTSSGLVWLIMGGLFAAVGVALFALLAFGGDGRATGLALTAAGVTLGLYALMLVARFAVRPGRTRLGLMAACMLSMAAVGLVGLWFGALIEGAPR